MQGGNDKAQPAVYLVAAPGYDVLHAHSNGVITLAHLHSCCRGWRCEILYMHELFLKAKCGNFRIVNLPESTISVEEMLKKRSER